LESDLETLILRADATSHIGSGHVMRCLALAQAWQDAGGRAVFVMSDSAPVIEERLRTEVMHVIHLQVARQTSGDAEQTSELAHKYRAKWVVVDGYQFGADYQRSLKKSGMKVLFVDDHGHAGHYSADLVVNQNACADEGHYRDREQQTRLLLGPRYAMLRREFVVWCNWKRTIPPRGRKVLVTMGGSDPDNLTLRVVEALQLVKTDGLEATVVIGGINSNVRSVEQAAMKSTHSIRFVKNAVNMAELMVWADIAVSAAGCTCWEMCLLGLPSLVIDLADNQLPIARCLSQRGLALHLGSSRDCPAERISGEVMRLLASAESRAQMSTRGRDLVDGSGASIVCAAMRGPTLSLRRAGESDARLLWEWANDSGVRSVAFSKDSIEWDEHSDWFQTKIADPNCLILIGENVEGKPVGQVRIDQRAEREGEIDVSMARDWRGAGYGGLLIDLAVQKAFSSTRATTIHAYIRPDNAASTRAFEKAGFRRVGLEELKGHPAVHYIRDKQETGS
jgi:UDP-2,4-diacetamido-2,4,6-trideoxy-beta-L-altropyranose hydrolase